jgi:hypothetical protein
MIPCLQSFVMKIIVSKIYLKNILWADIIINNIHVKYKIKDDTKIKNKNLL